MYSKAQAFRDQGWKPSKHPSSCVISLLYKPGGKMAINCRSKAKGFYFQGFRDSCKYVTGRNSYLNDLYVIIADAKYRRSSLFLVVPRYLFLLLFSLRSTLFLSWRKPRFDRRFSRCRGISFRPLRMSRDLVTILLTSACDLRQWNNVECCYIMDS